MIFKETAIPGVFVIELERFEDERGFFAEVWRQDQAALHGITENFERVNLSFNRYAGTLRGLHAQRAPYEEAKLVRCVQGGIFDVAVDIRPDSPTYLQWAGYELTAENQRALYIPKGCLHGFQTLVNDATVLYQVAGQYSPEAEAGARYDDSAFGVQWPIVSGERVLSEKDQHWPSFIP